MIRVLIIGLAFWIGLCVGAQAMPWPCWTVKYYAKKYSRTQLEQMAKDKGVVVSAQDRREIRACLRDKE